MRTKAYGFGLYLLLQTAVVALAGAQTTPALTPRQIELRARAQMASQAYLDSINSHSEEFGVDPALVMAVIAVESMGDPNAVSGSGAMGLMQLMPATCSDYGVDEPFDPDCNIRGGIAVLASHLRRYRGDLRKVLAAYNAGPRRADDGSWVKIGQTRRYVPAVLAYYAALKPTGEVPASLPEPGATPTLPAVAPVRVLDTMFETVRAKQALTEPEGVAENGTLSEAADAVLADYLAGKVSQKGLQARVGSWLGRSPVHPQSFSVTCVTTPDVESFQAEWAKQATASGRFIGLSHGLRKGTHVWVVILASL